MKELILTIPGDANELSPNARLHWRARHNLKQRWKTWAWNEWAEAGRPWVGDRVVIRFLIRRGRAVDPDNAAASDALISIVNGLKGNAFPDDSASHVRYEPVGQETGHHWAGRKACVIVTIRAETGDD